MQCCNACLFPIFHYRSHFYGIFYHDDLLLCSALMPVRIFCLSSAPYFVAHLHSNLDDFTIFDMTKHVAISVSCLWLGILGGILLFFFFVYIVTFFRSLYVHLRVVLATIYFLVGICALLGDVGVSFIAHLLHIAWVEASAEVIEVHSIEERAIGSPAASPSSVTVSSAVFNWWYPSPIAPVYLVFVVLCDSEGFSIIGFHVGHSAKPIYKLVVLDIGLVQQDGQIILNLDPIYK